jgi:predicted GNAT superfamily acetyltransferase
MDPLMIDIRPITTLSDMQQVEDVQRAAWGIADLEMVSVHMLHALQHNGAPLIGAYDGNQLVGFCLGVLGTVATPDRRDQVAAARLKLYSVMAGVRPEHQNRSIGYRLKVAQRQFALAVGVRLITWTYDPLQSRNAHFNISKLGAVCHTYHLNFHGDLGGINAGLPTDRFEVEWWVTSNRVKRKMEKPRRPLPLAILLQSGALLVNEATRNQAGLPVPPANYVSRPSNLMLVEVPAHFQRLKQQDFALAQQWRLHTRQLFTQLFADGFVVTDFVTDEGPTGNRRSFYLLTHESA